MPEDTNFQIRLRIMGHASETELCTLTGPLRGPTYGFSSFQSKNQEAFLQLSEEYL